MEHLNLGCFKNSNFD